MVNFNEDNVKVVLFGSLLSNPADARDVDMAVAYASGDWAEPYSSAVKVSALRHAKQIVTEWAEGGSSFARDLIQVGRLDMHYTYLTRFQPLPHGSEVASDALGAVPIPAPCGREVPFLAITPDTQVTFRDVWSIPAVLRAFPNNESKIDSSIRAMMVDEFIKHRGLYHTHIDIGGPYSDEREEDWSDYVTGLKALRSAIEHCPAWREARFPGKRLLARLNARGASREGIQYARNYSPGGRARLFFREKGVQTEYGGMIDYDTAEEMFVR